MSKTNMLERQVSPRRWNTKQCEDGLYVCRGIHDKHEACDYEKLTDEIWKQVMRIMRTTETLDKLYSELLMAVACIFPNEDRHDTALRYIREAEARAINESTESTGG